MESLIPYVLFYYVILCYILFSYIMFNYIILKHAWCVREKKVDPKLKNMLQPYKLSFILYLRDKKREINPMMKGNKNQ